MLLRRNPVLLLPARAGVLAGLPQLLLVSPLVFASGQRQATPFDALGACSDSGSLPGRKAGGLNTRGRSTCAPHPMHNASCLGLALGLGANRAGLIRTLQRQGLATHASGREALNDLRRQPMRQANEAVVSADINAIDLAAIQLGLVRDRTDDIARQYAVLAAHV